MHSRKGRLGEGQKESRQARPFTAGEQHEKHILDGNIAFTWKAYLANKMCFPVLI
jgi:hypothetical protein